MATEQTIAHWTKTDSGYRRGHSDDSDPHEQRGGHTLAKVGRSWILTCANGETHDLGRRASFDHADAILSR